MVKVIRMQGHSNVCVCAFISGTAHINFSKRVFSVINPGIKPYYLFIIVLIII